MWPDVDPVGASHQPSMEFVIDQTRRLAICIPRPIFTFDSLQTFVVSQIPDLDRLVHRQTHQMVTLLINC